MWPRRSDRGEGSQKTGEATEGQEAVGVVDGVWRRKLRLLERQVVKIRAQRTLQALAEKEPALGNRQLYPGHSGRLKGVPSQSPWRESRRISEGVKPQLRILGRRRKAVGPGIPPLHYRLLHRHQGIRPGCAREIPVGTAGEGHHSRRTRLQG